LKVEVVLAEEVLVELVVSVVPSVAASRAVDLRAALADLMDYYKAPSPEVFRIAALALCPH
jgi:hypothetical protein